MATHSFLENYLVIRKLYTRFPTNRKSRLEVEPPASKTEHQYKNLLEEANENYFHREYLIAEQNYLDLQNLILIQSHPEMPSLPNVGRVAATDATKIQFAQIMEMTRQIFVDSDTDGPLVTKMGLDPLIQPGEFSVNPAVSRLMKLGVDPLVKTGVGLAGLRDNARWLLHDGALSKAQAKLSQVYNEAVKAGKLRFAAETMTELGAITATYAKGRMRRQELTKAAKAFQRAAKLFSRIGDQDGRNAVLVNQAGLAQELGQAREAKKILSTIPSGYNVKLGRHEPISPRTIVEESGKLVGTILLQDPVPKDLRLPEPVSKQAYLMFDNGTLDIVAAIITKKPRPTGRKIGLLGNPSVKMISLDKTQYAADMQTAFYGSRVAAKTLDALRFFEEVSVNFVAYIPHLYFFVLPVCLGDTYLEQGRYNEAINQYKKAANYTFINKGIESAYLWLRMAKTYLRWGDQLFRQENNSSAKNKYRQIIRTDLTILTTSALYKGSAMSPMKTVVGEAVKKIKGQAHNAVNPKVVEHVLKAYMQLQKIKSGLNFLGLADDHWPVLRFSYLQSVAAYMADNAIQCERTFINFRTAAENQKFERIHLENDVDAKQAAVVIEGKRVEDAQLEVTLARQGREYAELRKQHADAALHDWDTLGADLASVNAALSWASNAANDQDIRVTGVRYRGERHDFDTDVEDFYETVGQWREWLNWELQRNRLSRQASEIGAEINIAKTREQQAGVRLEIQQMSRDLAQLRLDGAKNLLDYASDRMFDEDLWFRLAAELQDLAREYLDMATYAAFLMERAYDLEFDRNLNRIRLDYGIGGVEGLLGGDYLKRDIIAFTHDYLQQAQKKTPVRLAISLRDSFPAEFQIFTREGILPFRTDLEIFDRRYPGTYRRKIKSIEIFVEGLVPSEGVQGVLVHQGLSSEWRHDGTAWGKRTRVMPPERMILSSYQARRDFTVFQPSKELLGQFENLDLQGNWLFELPRSANNLHYEAITDVKLVIYFDAEFDESLRTHVKAHYPDTGGHLVLVSSRFHFPDQYFRLDADHNVTFTLHSSRFPYNLTELTVSSFGVRVLAQDGSPLAGVPLLITRLSDNSSASGTTNAQGAILGTPTTMAPFGAWQGATPVDAFRVDVDPAIDISTVGDILLSVGYNFKYRSDGSVIA